MAYFPLSNAGLIAKLHAEKVKHQELMYSQKIDWLEGEMIPKSTAANLLYNYTQIFPGNPGKTHVPSMTREKAIALNNGA